MHDANDVPVMTNEKKPEERISKTVCVDHGEGNKEGVAENSTNLTKCEHLQM
jgi:hypothetical protein